MREHPRDREVDMSKMPTPMTPIAVNDNSTFCSSLEMTQEDGASLAQSAPVSYSQDWVAYNEAQTNEKLLFLRLLGELTEQIPKPAGTGAGRPPADTGEMIFACCLKIYLNFSSRRAESDLKMAQQLEYIGHTPHFNTILKYLNDPSLTGILMRLVEFSALPLQQLEDKFAVDSTGFSTSVFARWYGTSRKNEEQRTYVKAHVMCGVRTNVICSIQVTPGTVSDFNMFPILVNSTAKRFKMKEVSADKGYSSRKCMEAVSKHGAIPFIAFRRHSKGLAQGSQIWRTMYVHFRDHKEDFLAHYHQRSNIESVFSMMKRKQGTFLRSRKGIAQINEILCKALVHNICVLIQEMFESGVHVDFQSLAEDELMCKTLP
jgi:transposase